MTDHAEFAAGAPVNVGRRERTVSAIAGSLLLYYIVKKHKANALLALAGGYLVYRGVSGHCSLYSLKDRRHSVGHNINVRTHVLINRPRAEVYAFWRKLENLNLFMEHVENIREIDDKRSSWQIKVPGLPSVQWEAEIVKEEEGKEISWQSLRGSSVENVGKINFSDTPGQGTTRIDALISYRAPYGIVGEGISRILTPLLKQKIEADIRGFKHYMENAK